MCYSDMDTRKPSMVRSSFCLAPSSNVVGCLCSYILL